MSSEITIIIPTIKINPLLIESINNTLSNVNNSQIFIISNNKSSAFSDFKNVKIYVVKEKQMSFKRNFGTKKAKTKYIGFIDSDAFPDKNWARNGIEILRNDKSISIVTGPELSFLNQTFFENVVGICNKSFLITGSHSFRKSKSSSRFFSEASACNILITKDDYLKVKGMNENLYVGEDRDFCEKVINILGKKIFFYSESVVFHKDRGFIGFVIQRMARGVALQTSLIAIIKSLKTNLTIKNLFNQRIELFVPLGFILFLLTVPLIFFSNIWFFTYFLILGMYFFSILFQSLFLCKEKILYSPFVFLFLITGTIIPGTAQILEILKFKIDISAIYRNSNDS